MSKKKIAHIDSQTLYEMGDTLKVQSHQLSSIEAEKDAISDGIDYLSETNSDIKKLSLEASEAIDELLDSFNGNENDSYQTIDAITDDAGNGSVIHNDEPFVIPKTESILTGNDWNKYMASVSEYADAHAIVTSDDPFTTMLSQREYEELDKAINDEFAKKTSIRNKTDLAFLITATALQVLRQYLLTSFPDKQTAKEGSEIMDDKYGNNGKLAGRYYYATEETIIGQKKVPFDIIVGSKKYELGKNGKGLDGNSHRFRTLGHDPILGYVFGTANIITNTSTWWNGTSHHIMYKPIANGNNVPTIAANADTTKIFDAVIKRYKEPNGKKIILEAIVKEHLHLKSDLSTAGLPIPFLQKFSPDFTQSLAEYGLDAITLGTVAKQAAFASLINFIISTVHSLLCAEENEMDVKLYKVRTKKIILISNCIASASNLVCAALTKNKKILDIGGLLETISHLFSDTRFILNVKREFIENRIYEKIQDELEQIERNEDKLLDFEYKHIIEGLPRHNMQ